jgi:hypothetical protein
LLRMIRTTSWRICGEGRSITICESQLFVSLIVTQREISYFPRWSVIVFGSIIFSDVDFFGWSGAGKRLLIDKEFDRACYHKARTVNFLFKTYSPRRRMEKGQRRWEVYFSIARY